MSKQAFPSKPFRYATQRFGSEAQLAEYFEDFLRETSRGNFKFYAEHEAGFGRPDVLLYADTDGSSTDVATLAMLRPWMAPLLSRNAVRRIGSVADLVRATGASTEAARHIAKQLEALGRLTRFDHESFEILPIEKFPFPKVVAIEIKLRDWNRALVQAFRYRNFATEAWVLLDHAFVRPAIQQLQRFSSTGVGLASFTPEGVLHVHQAARSHPIPDGPLAWRTQCILAQSQPT